MQNRPLGAPCNEWKCDEGLDVNLCIAIHCCTSDRSALDRQAPPLRMTPAAWLTREVGGRHAVRPCPAVAEGVVVQHLQQPLQVLQAPGAHGRPCRAARSECTPMHAGEGPLGQQAALQQCPDSLCALPPERRRCQTCSTQQLQGLMDLQARTRWNQPTHDKKFERSSAWSCRASAACQPRAIKAGPVRAADACFTCDCPAMGPLQPPGHGSNA